MLAPRGATLPELTGSPTFLRPEFMLEPEPESSIDLRRIWSVIWRNRLIILAILAASLAIGALSLFLSNPLYRATSSIEINNQPVKVLGTEDYQQAGGAQETERLLQTQIDILRSRSIAEQVAKDLNLAANNNFLLAQGVKPRATLKNEQVIEALRSSLIVSMPRNSRVVPVSFASGDPALAAKISNGYVDNLIASNLQRHFDTATYSKGFLQNQLALTKGRLEQSEKALLSYARSVGIVDPNAGPGEQGATNNGPRSLTTANLVDLNQSLSGAQNARIQAEGRWRQAQSTPAMSLPDVLTNPAIQQMTQKRAELQSQYEEELQRRRPEHPAVQQSAAAIRELDRQIATLAGSIRSSILNQYLTAQKQESQLSGAVSRLKGSTLAEQQLGIRYNILKREVDTNRELYDGLLQRYKQISAQAGATSNNISVVDRAAPPLFPFSPRPAVNLALALIFGIVLAGGLVTALELLRDGVRAPDEIEPRFNVPLLGVVPRLLGGTSAVIELGDPASSMSEAYQAVRTSVELSSELGSRKVILITSSRAGEGKSTTSLAMARDAASAGQRVLLIDADMRRPSLHSELNQDQEPGLSNFLTQQMLVESVIRETEYPGLSFIAAGAKPPSPAKLLSGQAFRSMLDYLRERYDQIIIDSPPVLGLADAPRLASVVDGTILVIEANRAQRGAIDSALKRLAAARAHIIGAVLVKFDPKKADFGSSYIEEYYGYGTTSQDEAPALVKAAG